MLAINGETQFITYRSELNLISVMHYLLIWGMLLNPCEP